MEPRAWPAAGLGLAAAAGWVWTILTPVAGGTTVGFFTSLGLASGFTAAAVRVSRTGPSVLVRKTGGLWVAALSAIAFTAYVIANGTVGTALVPNLLYAAGLFAMALKPEKLQVGAAMAAVGSIWWVVNDAANGLSVWAPANVLSAVGLLALVVPWATVLQVARPDPQ